MESPLLNHTSLLAWVWFTILRRRVYLQKKRNTKRLAEEEEAKRKEEEEVAPPPISSSSSDTESRASTQLMREDFESDDEIGWEIYLEWKRQR